MFLEVRMRKLVIVLLVLLPLLWSCSALTDVRVVGKDGKETPFKAPPPDQDPFRKDPASPFP